MKILHLEDDPDDSLVIEDAVRRRGFNATFTQARTRDELTQALATGSYDIVLVDNGLPGLNAVHAITEVKARQPALPVMVCSGTMREADVEASLAAGACEYVLKDHPWQLVAALRRCAEPAARAPAPSAMFLLVDVVQRLSMVRGLPMIVDIVRSAARQLTGADGATFVLRDGDCCYYVDEDAISPLWKGLRFPLEACISGWAMLNRRSTIIPDIYRDPRIPQDAYRPTFVRSLAMVPIRSASPIGAIGNYWATHHECTSEELMLLEALANTTAVAMENVNVYENLESQVRNRTRELDLANRELEAFSAAVSHDLRAPLRTMNMVLVGLTPSDAATVPMSAVVKLRQYTDRMGSLIDDLLRLSKISRTQIERDTLDLGAMAKSIMSRIVANEPERELDLHIDAPAKVDADRGLMKVVLENLLANAWKYSAKQAVARITFTSRTDEDGRIVFCCSDNGVGFDPRGADQLFKPFARLHDARDFPGIGIGLATVQRIIQHHGGDIWAKSDGKSGAQFMFTLRPE